MKIVCDACSAKYSIADEKVRGKVFKIRCKKCSNIIVVRGASSEEQPQQFEQKETKVFDYSGYDNPADAASAAVASGAGEPVWHVVINQEQIGPLTAGDVRERFARGEIDTETYTWKEGFGDWERLASVEGFTDLGTGGAPPADGGEGYDSAAAAMFGGAAAAEAADTGSTAQSDPADLFSSQMASSGGAEDPGADLFGSGPAASGAMAASEADSGGGLFAAASAGANGAGGGGAGMDVVSDQQLTGQRNENSVLFSLNNLASLASDSPAAPAPTAAPAPSTTGVTEGSGLIDIRAMAQVYLGDKRQAASSLGTGTGTDADIPVFSQPSYEGASPVMMPSANTDGGNMLKILAGGVGVLAIAVVVLLVVVLGGDEKEGAAAQVAQNDVTEPGGTGDTAAGNSGDPSKPETAGAEAAGDTKPGDSAGGDTAGEAAGGDTAGDTAAAGRTPPATEDKSDQGSSRAARDKPAKRETAREKRAREKREKEKREKEKRERAARSRDTSPVPTSKPSGGGGCDEVTCLVEPDKACCKRRSKSSRKPSGGGGGSDLPERLTRSDISSGIGKVRGRVASCGSKHNFKGKVSVRIKIGGNGKVSSASANGGNSGLRSCVQSAVKRAKFRKTQKGMSVKYPFVIR